MGFFDFYAVFSEQFLSFYIPRREQVPPQASQSSIFAIATHVCSYIGVFWTDSYQTMSVWSSLTIPVWPTYPECRIRVKPRSPKTSSRGIARHDRVKFIIYLADFLGRMAPNNCFLGTELCHSFARPLEIAIFGLFLARKFPHQASHAMIGHYISHI